MSDIENLDPKDLTPYWASSAVYRLEEPEPDQALLESITEKGQLELIIINQKNVIISGNRRWLVLKALNIIAKCRRIHFEDELAELEAMLEYNKHRKKSYTQIYCEADAWSIAIAEEAHRRQQATQMNGKNAEGVYQTKGSVNAELHSPKEEKKGSTLDEVAKKMGMKSRTLGKIIRVGKKATTGNQIALEILKAMDDERLSPNAADDLIELEEEAEVADKRKAEMIRKRIRRAIKTPSSKTAKKQVKCIKKRAAVVVHQTESLKNNEYSVILVDPPWEGESRPEYAPENYYPTMSVEKIIEYEPPAAEDCVLFLWTTAMHNHDAFHILEKWNFTYRGQLIWVKDYQGLGSWFMYQHEILLLATKGKINAPEEEDRPPSVFKHPKLGHSVKPEKIHDLIMKMFPDRKYCEMYARKEYPGWKCWGNQLDLDTKKLTESQSEKELVANPT